MFQMFQCTVFIMNSRLGPELSDADHSRNTVLVIHPPHRDFRSTLDDDQHRQLFIPVPFQLRVHSGSGATRVLRLPVTTAPRWGPS